MDRCDECGYGYADLPRGTIAGSRRRFADLCAARVAALDRPESPIERLWLAATALREHRGDGPRGHPRRRRRHRL